MFEIISDSKNTSYQRRSHESNDNVLTDSQVFLHHCT